MQDYLVMHLYSTIFKLLHSTLHSTDCLYFIYILLYLNYYRTDLETAHTASEFIFYYI